MGWKSVRTKLIEVWESKVFFVEQGFALQMELEITIEDSPLLKLVISIAYQVEEGGWYTGLVRRPLVLGCGET